MTGTEAKLLEDIRRLEAVNRRLAAHAKNMERKLNNALDQGARLAALLEGVARKGDVPANIPD